MKHKIAGYKLSRDSEHRRADRRNLAIALFTHGQITTTGPKAKSVQPYIERLISIARKGDMASRRRILSELGDPVAVPFDLKSKDRKELLKEGYKVNKYYELKRGPRLVKQIFDNIAPRYVDRPGGYTRIIKLARHRIGDGTSLVVLQLVGGKEEQGPQVGGQYSRRREKANRRMEVAAKYRKAKAESHALTATAPVAVAENAAAAPASEAQPST